MDAANIVLFCSNYVRALQKMALLYYLLMTLTIKFGQSQSGMRVIVSQRTLKESKFRL